MRACNRVKLTDDFFRGYWLGTVKIDAMDRDLSDGLDRFPQNFTCSAVLGNIHSYIVYLFADKAVTFFGCPFQSYLAKLHYFYAKNCIS
jgi:hypothetical protein